MKTKQVITTVVVAVIALATIVYNARPQVADAQVIPPPSIGNVVAGSGLTGGGSTRVVTVNVGAGSGVLTSADTVSIDDTYTQRRISGTCSAGNAIRVVNSDGTVTCEATGGGGGGLSDGDKGDVVVSSSGSVWTIDSAAVTSSKLGSSLTLAGTTDMTGVARFGAVAPGRGWYITNNELNQGYGYNAGDIGFLNYSSYNAGAGQFRDLWVGNGKQAATSILYVSGVANRVGINNNSPAKSLDVTGTMGVSGAANFANDFTVAGTMTLGPLGGNGGMYVNPTTGQAYFQPITSGSTNKLGFGFNVSNPTSIIDIADLTYDPGTSNPRTDDTQVTTMNALPTSTWNTTAGAKRVTDFFFDASHTKASGANRLTNILMRLDANVAGAADKAAALWIDKGEFWSAVHHVNVVRASTGGGPTASPAISSCGTGSPSSDGNDSGGLITIGGGSPTSCTLTFQTEWKNYGGTSYTPVCWAFDQSSSGVVLKFSAMSSTAITVAWSSGSPSIGYGCTGRDTTLPGP